MRHSGSLAAKLRGFGQVDHRERAARWSLWRLPGIGFRRMARLIDETAGEVVSLFGAPRPWLETLLSECGLSAKACAKVAKTLAGADPCEGYERELDALPARTALCHLGEPDYPSRLLDLEDPPVFIYVRGDIGWLSRTQTAAIVGSRKAGVGAGRLARSMACELAEAGVPTVSGGALGIDASAHRGCLEAGGPTLVALPGGVDRPTPRRNLPIFEQAIDQGALISEYPLGTKPRRFHFHRRNALIAALGDATIVVRAGLKSGTLITARAAQSLGRPLCALPGGLDEALAEGCLQLLVEGAQCVRGARDVLEHVLEDCALPDPPPQPELFAGATSSSSAPAPRAATPPRSFDVGPKAEQVLEKIRELLNNSADGAVHTDDIKRALDWSNRDVDAVLLELELVGAIAKRAGANAYRLA